MGIPPDIARVMLHTLPLVILVRFATFWYCGMYRGLWRFASVIDTFQIVKSVLISSVLLIVTFYLINKFDGYPRSIFLIDGLCLFVLVGGSRFITPFISELSALRTPAGRGY